MNDLRHGKLHGFIRHRRLEHLTHALADRGLRCLFRAGHCHTGIEQNIAPIGVAVRIRAAVNDVPRFGGLGFVFRRIAQSKPRHSLRYLLLIQFHFQKFRRYGDLIHVTQPDHACFHS